MNTPDLYERRLDRTLPDTAPAPEAENATTVDALAVHRDPSVKTGKATGAAGATSAAGVNDSTRSSVAWVRPSEMPILLGTELAGRGIDLHAELARRARRTPGAAVAKASRRITRTSISRPDTPSPNFTGQEGLGL